MVDSMVGCVIYLIFFLYINISNPDFEPLGKEEHKNLSIAFILREINLHLNTTDFQPCN